MVGRTNHNWCDADHKVGAVPSALLPADTRHPVSARRRSIELTPGRGGAEADGFDLVSPLATTVSYEPARPPGT